MVAGSEDDIVNTIYMLLKSSHGLTITSIVEETGLSRSAVRTALAKLEGAGKVRVREIGMAKVYSTLSGRRLERRGKL